MTSTSNIPTSSRRPIRKARALLAGLAAVALAGSALAPVANADRQDGHGSGADLAHVASYLRQDLDNVVDSGKFRVGCILVKYTHPPDPVDCTITATYKGEVVDSHSRSFSQPTRGWEADLRLTPSAKQSLKRSDKRINYIKLKLVAEDADGNVGTDVERISVIRGLYD